jgi:hypothetical protein
MSTLEEFVEITLSNNGVRVSSRLPIRERLMRAIDISFRSSGLETDSIDLETIASLILMRYSSLPHPSEWNMNMLDTLTQPGVSKPTAKVLPSLKRTTSVNTQDHSMIRRSQVKRK